MNSLQEKSAVCKIKDFFSKLFQLQIKSDYDVNISIFRDNDAKAASSTHSMSGACKCRLIKLASFAAIAWIVVCSMCKICYCTRK